MWNATYILTDVVDSLPTIARLLDWLLLKFPELMGGGHSLPPPTGQIQTL